MAAHAIIPHMQPKRTAWRAIENHYRKVRSLQLRDLFARDPTRGERLSAQGVGIYLDYAKNRITDQTIKLLIELAHDSGLQARIDAMFRGEKINITQNRPALHVALRAPRGASIFVDGENVIPQVHAVLDKMAHFCNVVRVGQWRGHTGKRIRNVINIGQGGYDLGPVMVYEALKPYSERAMTFRFVSNVDGNDFAEAVRDLEPDETLFIICCRSFSSMETTLNARSARIWSLAGLGGDENSIARHFVAISADTEEVARFGIDAANTFKLWDWISEPYSIGSAVGLSTMLAIGPDNFRALLDGLHQMDMHFLATPWERNLPVLMGLLTVWYVNCFQVSTIAVFPYAHYLWRFPSYLQQLAMESNGKHSTLIGTRVTQSTSPVYWGERGTNSQHSFYQLIHQGTQLIPCDFIVFGRSFSPLGRHQDLLVANALAQAEALAIGKMASEVKADGTPDWLVPHRVLEGNRPSNTIFAQCLSPETLGKLIALYEHSVFTQGVIWNVNSFDQWSAGHGQALAEQIMLEIENAEAPQLGHDGSTNALISRYRTCRET